MWAFLLLLLASSTCAAPGLVSSYDWRTMDLVRDLPAQRPIAPLLEPSDVYDVPDRPLYPSSYQDYSGPLYQIQDTPDPIRYVDQHLSEPLNMTEVRIGGFAGSGDTRGFGAYELPKDRYRHQDEEDELYEEDDRMYQVPEVPVPSVRRPRVIYPGRSPLVLHPIPPVL